MSEFAAQEASAMKARNLMRKSWTGLEGNLKHEEQRRRAGTKPFEKLSTAGPTKHSSR